MGAPIIVVSQFTLYADTRKGRRPTWNQAAPGPVAEPLVDAVVAALREAGLTVGTGVFGADMAVSLTNDGPMTIVRGDVIREPSGVFRPGHTSHAHREHGHRYGGYVVSLGTRHAAPCMAEEVTMFERFTDRARRVVVLAQEEARMLNHNYIGTEHILLGLVREGEGVAAKALEAMDISLNGVREQVQEIIGEGSHAPSGHIPFTPRAKKVLELSLREALQLGHNYIGTEHILLGLIREGEGVAAQVLGKLGATSAESPAGHPAALGLRGQGHPTRSGTAVGRTPRGHPRRRYRARPVWPQLHAGRARRNARPGHRPRADHGTRHAGAQPSPARMASCSMADTVRWRRCRNSARLILSALRRKQSDRPARSLIGC